MTVSEVVFFFCDEMGVDPRRVMSYEQKGDLWLTRYMIYSYLHYEVGLSNNAIAKKFDRTQRNIIRGITTIKNQMTYDKRVRALYDGIVEKIKAMD
jgi:hypothetical protein